MDDLAEDMWTPYKNLYSIFQLALTNPNTVVTDLELCLKKYKQNFTNFLRNPPKNEKSREQLRTALSEGVALSGQARKIVLSQELVDEAIIISDMFDLDEVLALELLCTAQRQQKHHPGLPRGLVAVLLYYDGRKAISCALRDMFQAVSGVAWSTELPREITAVITNYSQNLVEDSNILGRLIELLEHMDIEEESKLLTKNRAFGSKKHQNQVLRLYEEIRTAVAMALFHWSAQRGLPKAIAIRLLQHLASYKPKVGSNNIDDVTLIILMALLYGYDTSVLLFSDCNNPQTAFLPILSDPDFAKRFHEAIYAQPVWQTPQLNSIIKYSFGLTLASLRHAPSSMQEAAAGVIHLDEQLIDEALESNVFGFFYRQLLEKQLVYKNEFIFRRMHMLITDFIDFMHAKVSELRNCADEKARIGVNNQNEDGGPPPSMDGNFEMLMLCVAKLYGDRRGVINLCNDYWESTNPVNGNYAKNTARAVSLFKFIRLASELLPQTLFKSYVKMITGLTRTEFSARCAFNLLKQSQTSPTTYSVSWDHFFTSLGNYYNDMRNDLNTSVGTTGDPIFRNRSMPRIITQRETEHLVAVVGIIRSVAEHDEISRIMICENASWQSLQVLLGLISCSTALVLKAEILFTLAALSKSKETARSVWLQLEESQIIPTIPVNFTFNQCSLADEIDQNEARLETFTLTRGILELLYTLMTTYMPSSLGVGPRLPGYDAYVNFVLNSIVLKFYFRAYKDPSEKWKVGALCLKLIYFLAASYKPKASDFVELRDENPYPGFHVMMQLQTRSNLMCLLLRIIEEARERLDDYNQFHGKELLEECVLYALLLLEVGLAKKNAFFEAHTAGNGTEMLTGLNRILLDINPRNNQPDNVLNIIKFVTYNSWLPRHTLAAIKILSAVTMLPNVSGQILHMYAQGCTEKLEIRQGFVECLEMDARQAQQYEDIMEPLTITELNYEDDGEKDSDSELDLASLMHRKPMRIELQIKEAIVELFNMNRKQLLPNFVHFLLGIDVVRDFMTSERQQLAIDMTCSCINSLVLVLERHLERQTQNDEYCDHSAHIVERIYNLFYGLCINRRTSETVLRYFRLTCNDFLVRHLSAMPFRHQEQDNVLLAMSHLMKCVAIEIKLAATHGQTTRYNLLCDMMLGGGAETQRNAPSLPLECNSSLLTPQHSHYFYGTDVLPGSLTKPPLQDAAVGLHVNRLLDCLTLAPQTVSGPQLNFFDPQLLSQLLHECETSGPYSLFNEHKLHEVLHNELRLVQSTIASGQRKAITGEISLLMQHTMKLNKARTQRYATWEFMKAWCQLVQVLFSCMPEAVMPLTVRKQHIIDIIEKILMKVQPMQPLIEISIQGTEAVLLLVANLRYCCYQLEDQTALEEDSDGNGIGDVTHARANTSSSNLRFILKHIVEWIMVSEVKSQKLRINLYSSLLNCLRIVKRLRSDEQLEFNETFVARLDSSKAYNMRQNEDGMQKEMAAEVIGTFGEKLIDTICHDAISGHHVCRIMALACLDMISELHAVSTLSDFMTLRGYLKHILDSLGRSNDALCAILQPVPSEMRALFVYESIMAFLTRLSHTNIGAGLLLGERALGTLSNMSVFDLLPDVKTSELKRNDPQSFVPSVDERYRSILMPALGLCDGIVNSLGSRNNSAALQVVNFLFAHIDMIESILRTATPYMDLGHLQQLSAITNLLARTTTHDVATLEDTLDVEHDLELRSRLTRLQQLMIVVFGRFTVSETTIRHMLEQHELVNEEFTEEQQNLHVKYFLDITANLSLYCRNAVTCHGNDNMTSKYLLTTMINDITPLTGKSDGKKLTAIMITILNQLKGAIAYYLSQNNIVDNLMQQRASLLNITIGPCDKQEIIDISHRHNEKRGELMQAVFIAEQNLYLLWIHLDFYLRNTVVYAQENRSAINESNLDASNISVLNASQDEIMQVKQMLISTFNETFCTQLMAASESYTTKCRDFSSSLLRRIKALVQFAPVN
ncbi:nuclear pore complex protein Nup205 [Scaptodrosophila lebanonensis]|uniref:Nuclear pore complex protein Nup205 n=1 Tax=Drosophila lebanonensis TaxID=7225 RepID=A0A6J2U226_DROLE|nr:nuclear pore complex protein Nup205 [Scaptodrosophila lebanonensis]